jgi:hypothetical protein
MASGVKINWFPEKYRELWVVPDYVARLLKHLLGG